MLRRKFLSPLLSFLFHPSRYTRYDNHNINWDVQHFFSWIILAFRLTVTSNRWASSEFTLANVHQPESKWEHCLFFYVRRAYVNQLYNFSQGLFFYESDFDPSHHSTRSVVNLLGHWPSPRILTKETKRLSTTIRRTMGNHIKDMISHSHIVQFVGIKIMDFFQYLVLFFL